MTPLHVIVMRSIWFLKIMDISGLYLLYIPKLWEDLGMTWGVGRGPASTWIGNLLAD